MSFPKAISFLALLAASPLLMAEIAVIGPVHPVVEEDMVEWMKSKATAFFTKEKLAEMEREKTQAMRQYVHRPPGIELPRTVTPAVRHYDPSVTVPYDLRDHEGRLIHAAGTKINPLSMRSLTRTLLFFNADDPDQIKWAKRVAIGEKWNVKVIITSGSPVEVGEAWKKEVTFDQQGILVAKLGITHVPATVRQEGNFLRIDEILP